MKLTLAHTQLLEQKGYFIVSTVLSDTSIAAILLELNTNIYFLMVQTELSQTQRDTQYIPLTFITKDSLKYSTQPLMLYAWDGKPCVMLNKTEAYYFYDLDQAPKRINIGGVDEFTEDLFLCKHHFNSSTHSDNDLIAISLRQRGGTMNSMPRHFGILKMDIAALSLSWVFVGEVNTTTNPSLTNALLSTVGMGFDTPKIDSLMIKDNTLFSFCPGVDDSNVSRWGMDFYAICKSAITIKDGNLMLSPFETVYESSNLTAMQPKKSGAFGFFSSCGKTAVLTPVFSSDDWKGKPKLYDFASDSLQDLALPRGVSKGHILQCTASYMWFSKSVVEFIKDPNDPNNPYPPHTEQTTLFCLKCG
jgi:hypothetical protein